MKTPTHNIEITPSRNNVVPGGVAVWIHELRRLCTAKATLDSIVDELDEQNDWHHLYEGAFGGLNEAVHERIEAAVREQYQTDTVPDVDDQIGGVA